MLIPIRRFDHAVAPDLPDRDWTRNPTGQQADPLESGGDRSDLRNRVGGVTKLVHLHAHLGHHAEVEPAHLTVRFGKPFSIPSIEPGNRSRELNKWTHELMLRIAALVPESYRGIYANELRNE